MDMKRKLKESLAQVVLEGGQRIEAGIDRDVTETLRAIGELIDDLQLVGNAIALGMLVSESGCGNPDCPDCSRATEVREPIDGTAEPN